MNEFIKEYYFQIDFIIDTNQILTNFLNAKTTPECFLVDYKFTLVYQGLIDDWVKQLGRQGRKIKNTYLKDAITAHLNGDEININKTTAI